MRRVMGFVGEDEPALLAALDCACGPGWCDHARRLYDVRQGYRPGTARWHLASAVATAREPVKGTSARPALLAALAAHLASGPMRALLDEGPALDAAARAVLDELELHSRE